MSRKKFDLVGHANRRARMGSWLGPGCVAIWWSVAFASDVLGADLDRSTWWQLAVFGGGVVVFLMHVASFVLLIAASRGLTSAPRASWAVGLSAYWIFVATLPLLLACLGFG